MGTGKQENRYASIKKTSHRETKKEYRKTRGQALVVQKVDSTIHQINHLPVDNTIGFANAYPLDSDLSSG